MEAETPEDRELRRAQWLYIIAGGGYIDGTHEYEDMRRMEAEAEAIYATCEATPPWKKEPSP